MGDAERWRGHGNQRGQLAAPVTAVGRRKGLRSRVMTTLGPSGRHGDAPFLTPPRRSLLPADQGRSAVLAAAGRPQLPSPPAQGLAVRCVAGSQTPRVSRT